MKRLFLALLAIVVLGVGTLLVSPMTPLPGGALTGEVALEPVEDWSFAEEERFCHLETNSAEPRSVTVTCIVADGQLYVGCSACRDKTWSSYLAEDPKARYRVRGIIYEVTATRVTDPAQIDRVWRARAAKNGTEDPEPTPEDFWFFQLVSR